MSEQAVEGIHQALDLPRTYRVLYQPSATAAMECALRNLVRRSSFHFVHGAFSLRFFKTAQEIGLAARRVDSPLPQAVPWREAQVPDETELIAITHNETSTGLVWPLSELTALRRKYPEPLLAVDVTSSLGGVHLPWEQADLWFCSVQKCLGLPAGLGLVLVGPRALATSRHLANPVCSWQDFQVMAARIERHETVETPNVLAIALLARKLARTNMDTISDRTRAKAERLYGASLPWKPFVEDAPWRSPTVANFVVEYPRAWISRAAESGYTLGIGYGDLQASCVRIANFPATSIEDVEELLRILKLI